MEWKYEGVTSPEARKEIREYIDKWIHLNGILYQMYAYYEEDK